jgi:multidrug efflux pump subunit AcrA (membrane-fusion protein)
LAVAALMLVVTGCSVPGPASVSPSPTAAVTTARAEVRDLVQTVTASCALGYGAATVLPGQLSGVVTAVPAPGAVISPGEAIYSVDAKAAYLFPGTIPSWRDFIPWMDDGDDIAQLKSALVGLGYAAAEDLGTSTEWTWALSIAVQAWQADHGLEQTGELPLGTIVFLPGQLRVDEVTVQLGGRTQPGGDILAYTALDPRLECELTTAQRLFAVVGYEVSVTLPDSTEVAGTITAVEPKPGGNGQEDALGVSVTLEASDAEALQDGASARVTFTHTIAEQVLCVPVPALVALAGSGFGVQVQRADGSLEYVPVETGRFADTWVEIVSGDVGAGDAVVVTP